MRKKCSKKIMTLLPIILVIALLCNLTAFAGNIPTEVYSHQTIIERPLEYTGQNCFGEVTGKLTWRGNQVSSFTTEDIEYLYEYNNSGQRIEKRITLLDDSSKRWVIRYNWENEQVNQFEFTNPQQESAIFSGLYDETEKLIGFHNQNSSYFFKLNREKIAGIVNLDGEDIVVIQNTNGEDVITSNTSGMDDELLFLIILTLPAMVADNILDYESGIETTPVESSALIVKPPVQSELSKNRELSYQIVIYRYKPKGISGNPFGHLDARFNLYGRHYSYADYDSGANLLIVTDSDAYLSHQSNYQTYETANLWVSNNTFHSIYGFYNFPLLHKYDSGNFSGRYWKITSGPYTTYNLLNRNCSSIVRDALATGYGPANLNNYSSNWSNFNTPNSVFEMALYLQRVWI